jgi:hypothetical protein
VTRHHSRRHQPRGRAVAVPLDRHGRPVGYPHDPLHPGRPHEQVQRDVGSGLLLGAATLVVLMALLVLGLV